MGSLYLVLAGGELEPRPDTPKNERTSSPDSVISMDTTDVELRSVNAARRSSEPDAPSVGMGRGFPSPGEGSLIRTTTVSTVDVGNRRTIARALERVGSFADPAQDRFNYDDFKHGPAAGFPSIPGEVLRNPKLNHITKIFNAPRDVDGSVTPIRPSRAASFTGSARSIRHPSPSPSPRDASFPLERTSSDGVSAPPPTMTQGRPRRDTLEVPPIAHYSLQTNSSFVEPIPDGPSSPTIVISEMSESGK